MGKMIFFRIFAGMETSLTTTLKLDMVPRGARMIIVKDEFVISDNLETRVPPGLEKILSEQGRTRTLRPSGITFPSRIEFNAIVFVISGVVECTINMKHYRSIAHSLMMTPSGVMLEDISWQAGSKYVLIAYNDGKLFSSMTSESAKILRASLIAPIAIPLKDDRMSRYIQLLNVLLHVAQGGPEYYFQDDIIEGAAEMLCGGLAKIMMEATTGRGRIPREVTLTREFIHLAQTECRTYRSLDFYADRLCVSPKYLSRVVSKVSGKKAMDIIKENVISEAGALLKEGKYDVRQVSDILHFPNPSYFGRYFRSATGLTPRAYMLGRVDS